MKTVIAATAAALFATGVHAATITETFDFYDGSLAYGSEWDSLSFLGSQGNQVTVEAGVYEGDPTDYDLGLGVRYNGDAGIGAGTGWNKVVDTGSEGGADEILVFTFDFDIALTMIEFNWFRDDAEFDVAGDTSGVLLDESVNFSVDVSGSNIFGTVIAIGASEGSTLLSKCDATGCIEFEVPVHSGFVVDSLLVSYEVPSVPLPAGGLLLLTGLGIAGVARARRRT